MVSERNVTAQHRIMSEIALLERESARKQSELAKLQHDIARLRQQLQRVRRTGVAHAAPERLSSIQRLTVEAAILDRLRKSVPPETDAGQLWPIVQALGVTAHSTFRSHLRRMQEKGLILAVSRGRWSLAPGVPRYRDIAPQMAEAVTYNSGRDSVSPPQAQYTASGGHVEPNSQPGDPTRSDEGS
jgi:hypothetical protein